MSEETKEILFQLEIVARKHTIKVLDDGNIETMPASVVDELRLNNYSAKILLNYITNLQKENDNLFYEINGYLEEKERLKKKITFNEKSRRKMQQSLMEQIETYKSRNEKAVEYIKENTDKLKTTRIPKIDFNYNELLNILQGGDE